MKRKILLVLSFLPAVLFLAGCTEINEPITKDSTGIWNELIVYPLSWLIIKIAGIFGHPWGYGLSIIIVTLLIRFAILPLMVQQMKSTKAMQLIRPELEELKKKYSSKDAVTQQKVQGNRCFYCKNIILIQRPDVCRF